ncbi:MAG: recombinase family protein [Intestinimonas sp.]|jgi:DNA invertase Pin-like site-specific DNA recombinase|nr:recombinase family protein [Intestinimonas sp.]
MPVSKTEYAIYLRKSRMDMEAEARGEGDTLARHRAALLELAARQKLAVTQIYEEVVSGETISARPEMQKLLIAVEQGAFAGVLVIEVERLARGDTIDQGIVAQTFKYSQTKIITPSKTYDPNNEFDEEYFEFGLFMSRREYKTINRRLQRGRLASVKEGKWAANKAPYGYRIVKIEKQKGFTLKVVKDEARIVRWIFNWFTTPQDYGGQYGRLGFALIARRLNGLGIPSSTGKQWTPPVIRDMLMNPAYAGYVRWNFRPVKKTVTAGIVKLHTPRSPPEEIYTVPGLHPAIISKKLFHTVQDYIAAHPSSAGPKQVEIKNPLSGLVVCSGCGRYMIRRPYQDGRQETLLCAFNGCHASVSSNLRDVEDAILNSLHDWLADFYIESTELGPLPAESQSTASYQSALKNAQKDLAQIESQEQMACTFVEQGIYSSDVFLTRMQMIRSQKAEAQTQVEHVQREIDRIRAAVTARAQFVPHLKRVLETYSIAKTAKEKNALLKSVLEKVEYSKTRRNRNIGGGDMQLTLYPRLPPTPGPH